MRLEHPCCRLHLIALVDVERRRRHRDVDVESPTSLFFLFRPNSIRWDVATLLIVVAVAVAVAVESPLLLQAAEMTAG